MNIIFDCYNNEVQKRKIYLSELNRCNERKEELHALYLGGSNQFKEQIKGGKSINPTEDAQVRYVDETNYETYIKIEGQPYSINEYIDKLKKLIEEQDRYIEEISNVLSKIDGRECELFYLIKVQGYKPSKAVKKLAIKYDITESNIWRREYKRIKKYLKNNNNKS